MSDVSEPAVVCFLSNVWTVWSFQYIIHCTVIVSPGGGEVSDWRQTVFLSGPSVPDGGGGFALLPSLRGPANLATQSGLENIPSVKEVWRASLTVQTPKKSIMKWNPATNERRGFGVRSRDVESVVKTCVATAGGAKNCLMLTENFWKEAAVSPVVG